MRILILSQYYDPEPVPKMGELARELSARGHEVEVITGFPNYPSGMTYPGYRLGLVRREMIDGIPVRRAFEYPYHGRSSIGRLINYGSFVLSAPFASLFARRADVMYVWHPPLTVGLAAWLVSKLRGIPFVYDVQDIWPESAVLSGMMREGPLVRLMNRIEKFVYRRASHILVVTEGARQNLVGKGVPPQKVSVMRHWIDETLFDSDADASRERTRKTRGWQKDFVVLFAGNIGIVQGLETVIRAAAELTGEDRIRVVIVGEGTDRERLRLLASELGVMGRVEFIDRQPMTEMPALMAAADALLVHLKRSDLSRFVIPTKTLAYLAAGRPIVMAMEGAAADLVLEAGAGVNVVPEEPRLLAEALRSLSRMPDDERARYGKHGRAFLDETMTRKIVVPTYEEILRRSARQ